MPNPDSLSIYGAFYTLAWLAGVAYFFARAKKHSVPVKVVYDAAILCVPLGLAAAHLLFALVEPSQAEPFDKFFLSLQGWKWGYISFGGVAGILCALVIVAKLHRLPAAFLADLAAPSLFLASVFGRLGCFMHGCCYGTSTAMPWGVRFANVSSVEPSMLLTSPSHPVQLYEAALSVTTFLLLSKFLPRTSIKPGRGTILALCLLLYFAIRFMLEFFRIGATSHRILLGLSLTQIVGLIGGILCLLYMRVGTSRPERCSFGG